jgi:hypothetical protein
MDVDLKQELAEHQTLQDGIIKKIRESIKKQEYKENPSKLLRIKPEGQPMMYLNSTKWAYLYVCSEAIVICHSTAKNSITVNRDAQLGDDYQKIVDYIHRNSIHISELVNDWDRCKTRLREIYVYISPTYYIKLSNILSIRISKIGNGHCVIIYTKNYITGIILSFESNDRSLPEFQKLCELLSQ